MKAAICDRYGPPEVIQIMDVERPVPNEQEVLIKIRAASVNALDWRLMRGKPLWGRMMMGGLFKPKNTRPGVDIAGEVEAVGRSVTQFKPGDEVFGVCRGAFAEYGCAMENKLALKSSGITFEDAASMPVAATTALQGLRDKGSIRQGHQVVVDGAGGGVGSFAVQIAKAFGAEVTAVCGTGNQDTARSIGANHVIDYTREDFTQSGKRYDLIFGANAHHSIFDYRRSLNRNGIYVMAGGGGAQMIQTLSMASLLSLIGTKKMRFIMAKINNTDLVLLNDLLQARKIVPVIDRRYPLNDVAKAIHYLEEGHAHGKVIISIGT